LEQKLDKVVTEQKGKYTGAIVIVNQCMSTCYFLLRNVTTVDGSWLSMGELWRDGAKSWIIYVSDFITLNVSKILGAYISKKK
jgi:hypothetical protein